MEMNNVVTFFCFFFFFFLSLFLSKIAQMLNHALFFPRENHLIYFPVGNLCALLV